MARICDILNSKRKDAVGAMNFTIPHVDASLNRRRSQQVHYFLPLGGLKQAASGEVAKDLYRSVAIEEVEAVKVTEERKRDIREAFQQVKRACFRAELAAEHRPALKTLGLAEDEIDLLGRDELKNGRFVVHYIHPVELAGEIPDVNESRNLCFLSRETERCAHAFIDLQVGGMEPGEKRNIFLPRFQAPVNLLSAPEIDQLLPWEKAWKKMAQSAAQVRVRGGFFQLRVGVSFGFAGPDREQLCPAI